MDNGYYPPEIPDNNYEAASATPAQNSDPKPTIVPPGIEYAGFSEDDVTDDSATTLDSTTNNQPGAPETTIIDSGQTHTQEEAVASAAGATLLPKPELSSVSSSGEPDENFSESASHETSDEQPNAADVGGDEPPPVSGDTLPAAEDPNDPEAAKRAYLEFEAKIPTLPTTDEIGQASEMEGSISWMGSWGERSPIAPVFGDKREFQDVETDETGSHTTKVGEILERIDARRPDQIIDRQFTNFNGTLTEICKAINATADLAKLTTHHENRLLITPYEMGDSTYFPGPTTSYVDRFAISRTRDAQIEVQELRPPSGDAKELLRHDAPDGTVHLVERGGANRYRVSIESGRLRIVCDEINQVDPNDQVYFNDLNADLSAYRDSLLQAVGHAGFNPDDIIDPKTGTIDTDFVVVRVNPVVSNSDFQDNLPIELRANLMGQCYKIARRVNTNYASEQSLMKRAFRLAGYFREVLGHTKS